MKKIAIMLLAALMLFAFVACDPNNDKEPVASTVAKEMTVKGNGTVSVGETDTGKKVSDYQSNIFIAEDGAVTGTFKYIADNPAFGDAEDAGYYFCVSFVKDEGKYISQTSSTNSTAKYATDPDWILYLGDDATDAKAKTFTIKVCDDNKGTGAKDLIKLSFSGATFEKAN